MGENRLEPGSLIIADWPLESYRAARLVIAEHGEPHEATDSFLIWYQVGRWNRLVASRRSHRHDFPESHMDCVEGIIDYQVPIRCHPMVSEFNGSLAIHRTKGEVSVCCRDERVNSLAINLMHAICTGEVEPPKARRIYAQQFLASRNMRPIPFIPNRLAETADPDDWLAPDPLPTQRTIVPAASPSPTPATPRHDTRALEIETRSRVTNVRED